MSLTVDQRRQVVRIIIDNAKGGESFSEARDRILALGETNWATELKLKPMQRRLIKKFKEEK